MRPIVGPNPWPDQRYEGLIDVALPALDNGIGIDWGVASIATTTDPDHDFVSPEYAKTSATRLAKYQRRMARRKPKPGQKASNGYKTAKRDAAKLHKKVARQRQHTSRQWARGIVASHQIIGVEGFPHQVPVPHQNGS